MTRTRTLALTTLALWTAALLRPDAVRAQQQFQGLCAQVKIQIEQEQLETLLFLALGAQELRHAPQVREETTDSQGVFGNPRGGVAHGPQLIDLPAQAIGSERARRHVPIQRVVRPLRRNEWAGEIDHDEVEEIYRALESTIPGVREALERV